MGHCLSVPPHEEQAWLWLLTLQLYEIARCSPTNASPVGASWPLPPPQSVPHAPSCPHLSS